MNLGKISVIVPAYNMEKFLKKCLDSLISQTYQNLEIIVVNDCSTDNTQLIIDEFTSLDLRVKCVQHEINRGLFQTRLTGTSVATGDYIAFVDADDYLTVDYYRCMIKNSSDADMIVGNTVFESEQNWKYVTNMTQNFTKNKKDLLNEQILDTLMDNEGLNFTWHTVWNKLYKKSLWDKCVPYYEKINTHLIMTEDIAFSIVLYYFATKMRFVDTDAYIYYRHSEASTGEIKTIGKLVKTIEDLCVAFSFAENFLKEVGAYEKYEQNFKSFRARYFRWWAPNVQKYEKTSQGKKVKSKFLQVFEETELKSSEKDDNFFGSIITGYQQNFQNLKGYILNSTTKYVSFDIFDTLILRPFFEPSDLFVLMQKDFEEISGSKLDFLKVRTTSESDARRTIKSSNPYFEDVNIHEIYQEMSSIYNFSNDICEKLKNLEIEFELKYCEKRKTAYELFELAKYLNKEILITSDMYLPQEVIEKMLEKCGYFGYTKLYISSETRVLKYTQNMFKYVLKDLKIKKASTILHIGDNLGADITSAKACGITTFLMPKTKDVFQGLSEYKNGLDSLVFYNSQSPNQDSKIALKSFAIRCMLAKICNKFYDNPYISYNEHSAYNANFYYMGYFLLGMNLTGLANWLAIETTKTERKNIHFIARDGYLPKKIYDIISKHHKNAPNSNYLYASRKSLIPTIVKKPSDIYLLPQYFEIAKHSTESLLELLSSISKPVDADTRKNYLEMGVLFTTEFETISKFNKFAKSFIKISLDEEKIKINSAPTYFKNEVSPQDCTFDLGYSGKIQEMICNNLDFNIDTYFLHSNGSQTADFAQKNNFKVNRFYQNVPNVTGILREYLVSDYAPSCVGYTSENQPKPIFETIDISYQERFILDELFQGACDFATEFTDFFGEYLTLHTIDPQECSFALEQFLASPSDIDKKAFDSSYVEDSVHSATESLTLNECWNSYISTFNAHKSNQLGNSYDIQGIYQDGLIIAFAKKINNLFPEGGRKRKILKKIVEIFK